MSHRGSDTSVCRKAVRVTACTWDICRHSDASSAWMLVGSETCASSQPEDAAASLRDTVDRASVRRAVRHWRKHSRRECVMEDKW